MPLPNHWQQTTFPRNNNTSVFGTKKRSPSERPAHIKPIIMEDVWEVLVSYVELGGGSEQHYNFLFSSRFRKASKKLSTFHQRWTSRLRQKLPIRSMHKRHVELVPSNLSSTSVYLPLSSIRPYFSAPAPHLCHPCPRTSPLHTLSSFFLPRTHAVPLHLIYNLKQPSCPCYRFLSPRHNRPSSSPVVPRPGF